MRNRASVLDDANGEFRRDRCGAVLASSDGARIRAPTKTTQGSSSGMNRTTWLFVCVALIATHAEAANRTVCQSGCQYTSLQAAINDAVPGDVLLLRAGETFVGNFVLKS